MSSSTAPRTSCLQPSPLLVRSGIPCSPDDKSACFDNVATPGHALHFSPRDCLPPAPALVALPSLFLERLSALGQSRPASAEIESSLTRADKLAPGTRSPI